MKFTDKDLKLLEKDAPRRRRGYWFPYWFKAVAWLLTIGTIGICSYYLILYGLTFGLVKCYLWLTAVILSLITSAAFIQPVKIVFVSAILSGLVKSPPALQLKRIQKDILENPYNELKSIQVFRFRFDNAFIYKPLPAYRLQNRAQNIKYHLEQRKLFVEVLIYMVFMLALVYLVVEHGSWATYYSTNVAKHLVVFGSYTDSIPFSDVNTYDDFLEYMNMTFLPSLYGSTEREAQSKNTDTCAGSKYIKSRLSKCTTEYSWINMETRDFTLWWNPLEDQSLTYAERIPWIYQSPWKTGAISIFGILSSYSAGGYILEFAKSLEDSRVILDFMDTFQWIDSQTRVVIIEFTLYCVNVNLFNVIHLIAEQSASGYFVTSYQIDTAKFVFLAGELELISVCMMVVFILLLFLFTIRQAIRVERTSFQAYLREGNPTVDILIIVLGLFTIVFIFLRSYYVASLLYTLHNSQNNVYVSFAYASVWNTIATYILTALVVLTAIKFFQILRFRVVFLQLQETLRGSYRYFLALALQLIIILIAFSLLFYSLLVAYDFYFSSFSRTISKLIGLIACLGKSCDTAIYRHTPWFLAPIFYILYVVTVLIVIISFFASIICYYLGKVKNTQIDNKYNALAYFKHILTANDKTDIIRLRGGNSSFDDSSPLRLRGGGKCCSRICFGNRQAYQLPPRHMVDSVVISRGEPIFTRARVYDYYSPYRVTDKSRFEMMRRLTKAELMSDKEARETERQNAMKVIMYKKLIIRNSLNRPLPQEFYKGRDNDIILMVTTENLLEMKQIVDDYGRQELFQKYEDAGLVLKIIDDDEEDATHFIADLDEKLSELQNVAENQHQDQMHKKEQEQNK